MNKRLLLAMTSVVALVSAAPQAFAQTAPQTDPEATTIEEVVVTAQRRSESAQKAAISVDAISAEELVNVGSNPSELSRIAPSVQFFQSGNVYPQTSIRGVGNQTVNPSTDATVGFNFDGVPITRVAGSVGLFYDLQRVEVLKGPQGTLYGRNQTGGTVNIIPNAPIIGQQSGNLTVEAGNYALKKITGAINVPMGDRVALRAALNIIDREGYYESGLQDDVGQSGRVTVRVEPNDAMRFQLGVDYHHQGGKGGGSTLLNSSFVGNVAGPPPYRQYTTDGKPLDGNPWIDVNQRCDGVDRSPTSTSNLDWDDWFYTTGNSPCRFDGKLDNTFFGVTGLAEIDLWGGTLTIIPALRTIDLNSQTVGGTNLFNGESSNTKTLEARYASNADARFSYIVGGFLLDDSDDADFRIAINYPNNNPVIQSIQTTTKSWAVFASGRFSLTDTLRLRAGVRQTHDDKTFAGTSNPGAPQPSLSIASEKSWDEVTYDASIEWNVAPNSLVYLNYGHGYKAGGFFFATPFAGFGPGAPTSTPTTVTGNSYEPEYVDAITLGTKNTFFNRRLLLNLEVFQYKYKDQQLSTFGRDDWIAPFGTPDAYTVRVFLTTNVGSVDILGGEFETQFLLTDNTLLSLNVQRLDTEISGTVTNQGLNTAGYPAQQAADWAGTAGIKQTFPLSNGAEIVADLRGQYRGNIWIGSADYLPFMLAEPIVTGDVSLTYDSGAAWRLTGYVNNFTDEDVPTFFAGTGEARSSAAGPPSSAYTAQYRAPRTFGVRLGVNF